MPELTGRRLTRTDMVRILESGGSVSYHGKQGSRIISRLAKLPSLAEMVEDGYESPDAATAQVEQQLAALEEQKAALTRSRSRKSAKTEKQQSAAEE